MSFMLVQIAAAIVSQAAQAPHKVQIDPVLVVEFATEKTVTKSNGELSEIFGHAQATYGQEILTTDKLTIVTEPDIQEIINGKKLTKPGPRHFVAEGHVHIEDIDGTLDAEELDYDWISKTGSAKNAHLNLQGFMVDAATATIDGKLCELDDVFATPCGNEKDDILAMTADKATIDENGLVHIIKPRLYIMGHKVVTLKQYTIAPNRRASGQPLPNFGYSKSNGFTSGWVPGIFLNDNLAANGSIHLAQRAQPSEDLMLSQGLMKVSQEPAGIVPYSDFAEPHGFGYFENVFVADPGVEHFFVGGRRESLSFGTFWNEGPAGRQISQNFNKPVDVVYETASSLDGFGFYGQLRAQQVQQIKGPVENRIAERASIALPDKDFFKNLPGFYPDIRFDSFTSIGDAKPYGWVDAQIGLVDRPNKYMRIGLSYTKAGNFGTPLFITDELYRDQSVNLRTDLLVGPRTFSLLLKYDPVLHDWYDTEFEFSQAMGCLEPYFIYRAFPQGYVFGLKLRLDNVVDALKRRGALKTSSTNYDDR